MKNSIFGESIVLLYKCAKIPQSLQHNLRPLLALGLGYFYSKV